MIAEDAVICPEGGIHTLTYQGRKLQRYRCTDCGGTVLKVALKAATDA